jgi:enoyl-[acyl-carrier protein] reductase I
MYTINLEGRVALILGVANKWSIAWHIAKLLDQAGAELVFTYQNERLKRKVAELVKPLGSALLACDVTDEGQIEAVFDAIKEEFGRLDILVHSVAFAPRQDLEGTFLDTSREGFLTSLEVSAYSLIPLARCGAPLMKEGGSILAMTYIASERVIPGYNVMSSAKAALENVIRQLAYELGPKKIRVNAISAGPLSTLAARGIRGFTKILHLYPQKAPLRRNIDHQEVAKSALFLCSDLASGITGEIIHVDAGYHIMGV